jgi:cytochrome c oxidase assembly factor CtaG
VTTRDLLLHAWQPGLVVPSICAVTLAIYFGVGPARRTPQRLCFVGAVGLFFVALASPIGVLARGYLFSAHMLQHLILLLAVPPLVLLGIRGQPDSLAAREDASAPRERRARYLGPWLAGVGAMWLWHERSLCNAAATSATMAWIQTASLIGMGLLFWRPILLGGARAAPLAAVAYLFTACLACTVLGILVTFSPVQVCNVYAHPVDRLGILPLLRDGWGLSPRSDQQLGGLMMWIPTCLVYGAAILATLGRYYGGEAAPSLVPARAAPHRTAAGMK